ncbi:MAG: right-handed parallel beta-helix repeat-containing protein [Saprospiraceae bacterium]|nr:right-handed parallel beta-helix repeat-containing protein [Saprospiraceae bacterium]
MNKTILRLGILCLILSIGFTTLTAQVGINTTGVDPDPSAILDVNSTDRGFLTPRMTSTEKDAIANPATGLLIYQTNDIEGFHYNQGTTTDPDWVRIGNEDDIDNLNSRIPIDSVAYFDTYNGKYASYVITKSGSYYMTDGFNLAQTGAYGIIIDSDNVTLDMNGFNIYGDGFTNNPNIPVDPGGSGSGIFVDGEHFNITIKNGSVFSFQDDGIEAPEVKKSIFQNLVFVKNGQHGMNIGDHNLLKNCTVYFSVFDGMKAGVGNNFIDCRGERNGEAGIQADSSNQFISCTAYSNTGDGITSGVGSLIKGCVVSSSDASGINVGSHSRIIASTSYNNDGDGILVDADCFVRHCVSSENNGSGIKLTGQTGTIVENSLHENDLHGLHCANTNASNVKVIGNLVTDNDDTGMVIDSGGGIVIQNASTGHLLGDYSFHPNTNHGPIVHVKSVGDISTVANSDHPLANFIY